MGDAAKRILELALALPAEERRDLIDALVASAEVLDPEQTQRLLDTVGDRLLIETKVDRAEGYVPVSYTHLTLPTIYSV